MKIGLCYCVHISGTYIFYLSPQKGRDLCGKLVCGPSGSLLVAVTEIGAGPVSYGCAGHKAQGLGAAEL